jgi:hypothetical protein
LFSRWPSERLIVKKGIELRLPLPRCADLNSGKRKQTADLRGRIALLTGGRVKIGFHVGLKLLRAGATVVATTRFPHNAASRYAAQPDAVPTSTC